MSMEETTTKPWGGAIYFCLFNNLLEHSTVIHYQCQFPTLCYTICPACQTQKRNLRMKEWRWSCAGRTSGLALNSLETEEMG